MNFKNAAARTFQPFSGSAAKVLACRFIPLLLVTSPLMTTVGCTPQLQARLENNLHTMDPNYRTPGLCVSTDGFFNFQDPRRGILLYGQASAASITYAAQSQPFGAYGYSNDVNIYIPVQGTIAGATLTGHADDYQTYIDPTYDPGPEYVDITLAQRVVVQLQKDVELAAINGRLARPGACGRFATPSVPAYYGPDHYLPGARP